MSEKMTRSRAFLVSLAGHVLLLGLAVALGVIFTRPFRAKAPIEVTLLQPGPAAPPGSENEDASPEARTEIVVRKKPQPPKVRTVDPSTIFDESRIPKVDREKPRQVESATNPSTTSPQGVSVAGSGGDWGYAAHLVMAMKENWNEPSRASLGARPKPVRVTLTVLRDGTIASYQVVEPSGIARLDASVREAVDTVKRLGLLAPLPEVISGASVEFNLQFEVL